MRKLQDLVTNQEQVWLWFATDKAKERFVRQCTEEGFAFPDGTLPTVKSVGHLMAICSDRSLWHLTIFVWVMSFKAPGMPQRIDYEAYSTGQADYICHDPKFISTTLPKD